VANRVNFVFLVTTLLGIAARTNAETPTNSELLARVQQGDPNAILEAGQTGDKNFIPILEKMAKPHFVFQIDPEKAKLLEPQVVEQIQKSQAHPVYDDRSARHARMALAKLGVKKYLDEILTELTDPTKAPVAKTWGESFSSKHVGLEVQMKAFKKLAYIKDPSTVRALVSFLYAKESPRDYIEGEGSMDLTFYEPASENAMKTLLQIVYNPPKLDLPPNYISLPAVQEGHDARVKAWQRWWEQNKDKYP
jgi:hypothetical protein